MEFKVVDLLNKRVMKGAKYIGASDGLNNKITGVTILDSPDLADWLKGGELILTSLHPIQDFTDDQLEEWIKRLTEKKVSCLVIKIQRVFNDIPTTIITASKLSNLPVIQLPKDIPFIDIMYPVMEELFNSEVTKLTYFKEVHDRFTALSLAGAGTEKIIETLEELIGNKVLLYDNNGKCIAATDNKLILFYDMDETAKRSSISSSNLPIFQKKIIIPDLQEKQVIMKVVPIETINNIKMNLTIVERIKKTTQFDVIAIESAVTALELELVKKIAIAEVEEKYKNDIIDDILSGKKLYTAPTNVTHLDLEGEHVVVVFHLQRKQQVVQSTVKDQQNYYWQLRETIHYFLPQSIIRLRNDRIIVLWKVHSQNGSDKRIIENMKKTVNLIQVQFNQSVKDYDVQVGIGNIADSISDIANSYKASQDALELCKIYEQSNFVISFDELGIYRLLYQFKDLSTLKNFIPEALDTLMNYQHSIKNDLIETLKVYLQCNQNAGKAANKIFVHPKTIAYRIERIKEITRIDFDNAEEILTIQVGLKIIDILNTE